MRGRFPIVTVGLLSLWTLQPWLARAGDDPSIGEPAPRVGSKRAAEIVARVDDRVILLEDVIGPMKRRLEEARKQMPAAQYLELENNVLKQRTQQIAQRIVILKELDERIGGNAQVLSRIRKAAADDFEKHLQQVMRDAGMKSRDELLKQFEKEGTSFEDQRKEFIDTMLSQQYVGQLVRSRVSPPTREEMLEYYHANEKTYREDAGVVWRHIEIKMGADRETALRKAMKLQESLSAGGDFAELAKKHSEGPMAASGGLWPLTSKGSYAEPAVDEAIFALPVGASSGVLKGSDAYHIVRVEKRNDGGLQPFSEVQDEIRKKIFRDRQTAEQKAKIDELMARHYVETIFDSPSGDDQAGKDPGTLK